MPETAAPSPPVSVVLCADAAPPLRTTLASLSAQTLGRDGFEVVVVDDGRADGVRDAVEAAGAALAVRYSPQRAAGRASGLDHGVFLARGELVALLDPGVAVDPAYLERHRDAHRRLDRPEVAVLGVAGLAPPIAADPVMEFLHGQDPLGEQVPEHGDEVEFGRFRAGRSSWRRAFLVERGVFDPRLSAGCEDVELAWRLGRAGLRIVLERRATANRAHPLGLEELRRGAHALGQVSHALSRLHSEEPVQRWTEVAEAGALWRRVAPVYDDLVRSAQTLDRIVRARRAAGLAVDAGDLKLLHAAYWNVLRATRARGAVEHAAELGVPLA
jgi:hypothetical protein